VVYSSMSRTCRGFSDAMKSNLQTMVILDRDGVLNYDSTNYIKTADEWLPIPGSAEAIAALNTEGFDVYIVTNQSGIGRGLFDEVAYAAITDKMLATIAAAGGSIKAVIHCPHTPEDDCDCRKPKTGMFTRVHQISGRSIKGMACIGDSLRDLEAALDAGCSPILVKTGNGANTLAVLAKEHEELLEVVTVYDDLAAAAAALIANHRGH
jgi:D-glycero-D-manno-heptose 1,7-bisphosphate phosphatase